MGEDTGYLKLIAEKYQMKLNFIYQSQEMLMESIAKDPPLGSDAYLVQLTKIII